MALYQHTWGLTAMRKSEYEIMIQADPITKEAYDSERPGASGRPLVSASHEVADNSAPLNVTPSREQNKRQFTHLENDNIEDDI